MPVLFSKTGEYALKASIYLAREQSGKYVSLTDISEALNIPYHFLSKVLQQLAKNKIVSSQRGTNGGFRLSKPPSEINLLEIIYAIDGKEVFDDCVLGFPVCNKDNPCPLHSAWEKAKESFLESLRRDALNNVSHQLDLKLKNIKRDFEQISFRDFSSMNQTQEKSILTNN